MLGAVKKGTMYDTDDITRTTIKETTIHDTREGNIGKLGYQDKHIKWMIQKLLPEKP